MINFQKAQNYGEMQMLAYFIVIKGTRLWFQTEAFMNFLKLKSEQNWLLFTGNCYILSSLDWEQLV